MHRFFRVCAQSLVVILLPFVTSGCATVAPLLRPASPSDEAQRRALDAASEQFYRAETPEALREAVEQTRRLGPDSARFHEVAARLALLEGQEGAAQEHLMAALLDTGDDAALLHLHLLLSLDQTYAERERVRDLLRALAQSHPSEAVRAVAAYHWAMQLHVENRLDERDAAIAGITGRLAFAVVGTWDNDSGKAFDAELSPETRPGYDQVYEGRSGPLRWRKAVPTDPRGRLELASLLTPTRWAAAFAQAQVTVPTAGAYELRLTTTDPTKVWVDGSLVFAAAQIERSVYDHLVIPVTLAAGAHRVLVKSAHRDGAWYLAGRLVPAPAGAAPQTPKALTVDDVLTAHLHGLDPTTSPRAGALLAQWAHFAAGGTTTVKAADANAKRWPKSITARVTQVDALWFNQERGRTADLLQTLDADWGDALAFVRLRHIRFQQQQGQKQKARDRLLAFAKAHPTLREPWELLVETWRAEGWVEDELNAELELRKSFGATPEEDSERARTLLRLGRRAEAVALYEAIVSVLPRHADTLRRLSDLAAEAGELETAEKYLTARLDSWPTDTGTWLQLAEIRRRRHERALAEDALRRAALLAPDAPAPPQRKGDLAYEAGDVGTAVKAWRQALEFNPENEALANRVEFLSPENRGPWWADVPDEAAIEKAVQRRVGLKQLPGADVAWLLDHEVTLLNSDGSTSNVVTAVVHTFNAQGRDRAMRQSIPSGRLRMMHSYSVDEKGVRSEASGERAKTVFFRGMQPGSTLVLQYRLDTPPQGYLSRYLTKSWTFQSASEQRLEGTFVVWAPLGVTLHEERVGQVERTQDKRGEQLRIAWQARDMPPLVPEPSMPTAQELAANIRISTVPDWKTWLSWEQALLEGAFRDSPELDAVVKTLAEGNPSEDEKVKRIHQFVMEEIRYQQDYETFIAGVKPHPAPMVLERKYGDCKDKAVLFIELAKKLGLDAHFALVRTRDVGPVMRDVPMQQFNHAIVYVPEQKGIAAGRFYDPTAELLDLDSVRSDDVGTKSLVFDPGTGEPTWRDIDPQPPEFNKEISTLTLALDATGGAKGTLALEGVGRDGSYIRRAARNAEVLTQAMQRMGTAFIPGASTANAHALEVKSLRAPASIQADLEAHTVARVEGDTLRLRIPSEWNPRTLFTLATRRHPLVLGAPAQMETRVSLTLPSGYDVKKMPAAAKVELPCLSLRRDVSRDGATVSSVQTFRNTCERISASEYAQYRAKVDDMVRMLEDELVIAPVSSAGKTATAKKAPAPGSR